MCIEITYSLFLPPWRAACRLMCGTGARHCDDPDFICSGILSGMFHERPSSPALTSFLSPAGEGERNGSLLPAPRGEGRGMRGDRVEDRPGLGATPGTL